jgi:hypothetical protein
MDKAKLVVEDAMLNIGVLGSLMALHYAANMVNQRVGRYIPGELRGPVIGGALSFAQQSAYKMFAQTPHNVLHGR